MSLILPGLYLGDISNAKDIYWLDSKGITYIVNCAKEVGSYFRTKAYLNLDLDDSPYQGISQALKDSYLFIDNALQRGNAVLVHCYAGISRSSTIVIYYIMRKYGWSLQKAYQYVKNKRSIVQPNHGFIKQLSRV